MIGCAERLCGCEYPDIPGPPGALAIGGAELERNETGLLKFPETVYGSLGRLGKMGWNPTLGDIPVGPEGGAPCTTAVWLLVAVIPPASPLNSLRNLSMFFSILSDKSSSRPGRDPT